MKKPLYSTNNEHGLVLPFVLFMVLLIFIFLSSALKMYQNDIYLTDYYLEHIQVETLFQMAQTKFTEEILSSESPPPSNIQYEFPNGSVTINILKDIDNYYFATYEIRTNRLDFKYNIYTRFLHV